MFVQIDTDEHLKPCATHGCKPLCATKTDRHATNLTINLSDKEKTNENKI